MASYLLGEKDKTDLKKLCDYLCTNHRTIAGIPKESKKEVAVRTKDLEVINFATVFGYNPDSAINSLREGYVSVPSYKNFQNKFEQLESIKLKSVADTTILEDFNTVNQRILNANTEITGLQHSKLVTQFSNTSWYVFDRWLKHINRRYLEFDSIRGNEMNVRLHYCEGVLQTERRILVGKAFIDSRAEFLVMQFKDQEINSLPTNFLVRINTDTDKITLCIGHETRRNWVHRNVVSKVVVLKVTSRQSRPSIENYPIEDYQKMKEKVPEPVFRFLYNRSLNRLASPHKQVIITNENLLKEWETENWNKKKEKISLNCFGKYKIYYKRNTDSIGLTIDNLEITTDKNTGDVIGIYKHDIPFGGSFEWIGKASQSISARSLYINLKSTFSKRSKDDNKIFLILNLIPDVPFSILTGTISGIRDENNGCISLSIVAKLSETDKPFPETENQSKEIQEDNLEVEKLLTENKIESLPQGQSTSDIIIEYFNAYQSRSRAVPPMFSVNSIESLKNCIDNDNPNKKDKY